MTEPERNQSAPTSATAEEGKFISVNTIVFNEKYASSSYRTNKVNTTVPTEEKSHAKPKHTHLHRF